MRYFLLFFALLAGLIAREPTDEFITRIPATLGGPDIAPIQKLLNEGWTVKHLVPGDTYLLIVFSPPSIERYERESVSAQNYTAQKQAEYKRRQEEYNKKKNQPVEKP